MFRNRRRLIHLDCRTRRAGIQAVVIVAALLTLPGAVWPAVAQETRVPIRMFDGLPLVAVSVNDAPPRWFFVDTGSSVTTLAESFAAELALQRLADFEVETTAGKIGAALGTVRSLRVGGAELGGGAVVWHALDRIGAPKGVDGVLGFDRLSRVNFLLDYAARSLRLDPGGALGSALRGERVPFTRSMGRPVVDASVQVQNDPERRRRLVVDTGATTAVLLDRLTPGSTRLETVAGAARGRAAGISLRLGATLWRTAAVIVAPLDGASRDDQGLLPASLFVWMYFDVARGEIIWQRAG